MHATAWASIRITWNKPVKNKLVLKTPAGIICNTYKTCMTGDLSTSNTYEFDTTFSNPTLLRIYNGSLYAELFIDPSTNNSFVITTPDSLTINPLPNQLLASVEGDFPSHLHAKIQRFQYSIEDFYVQSSLKLIHPRGLGKDFLIWKAEQLKKFPDTAGFFYVYMRYTLASMEEPIFQNRTYLFNTYIKNNTVQLNQPAWATFFKNFYRGEFNKVRQGKHSFDFIEEVNRVSNYTHLRDAFLLMEPDFPSQMVDVFLLCQLFDACQNKHFNKSALVRVFHSAVLELKNELYIREAKEIANTIAYTLPGFQYQKPEGVPSFQTEKDNLPYFVFFWADWNPASLLHLQQYKRISAVYGKKYRFISIHDGNKKQFDEHIKSFNKEVIHLHDADGSLFEHFHIAKYPSILFLDEEFRLIEYNMPLPAEELESWIKAEATKKKN